jgi:hypothetical protein
MEMECSIIQWNDLKSKLKSKFPDLTNADLTWRHSTQEDLLEMIAGKLGMTYREILEEIDTI